MDFGLPRSHDPPHVVRVQFPIPLVVFTRALPFPSIFSVFIHHAALLFPLLLRIRCLHTELLLFNQSVSLPPVGQPLHFLMSTSSAFIARAIHAFPLLATHQQHLSPLYFLTLLPLFLSTVVLDVPPRFTSLKRRRSPFSSFPFKPTSCP